ncbi:hypothetical protein [Haloechinothrix salitolerans]|uniref:Uncharacterized protein n=1 Tax=Haloechinothrix salitolerans TaxID=926830 RepID=A0ABW2C753_9PSEU
MASDTNGNPPAGVTPDEWADICAAADRVAAESPPLTAEQADTLAALFAPVTAGGTR